MPILLPKQYVADNEGVFVQGPLIFLGGPIRGGGDWQAAMCDIIFSIVPGATIVCPCRWDITHRLHRHFVSVPVDESRGRQLDWERYYLRRAGIERVWGCVLFYLPVESKVKPHPGPEPYAVDTRGELGEWRLYMRHEDARVVVGAEEGFYGLSQIQRNFDAVLQRPFLIHSTMEETARAALAASAWMP